MSWYNKYTMYHADCHSTLTYSLSTQHSLTHSPSTLPSPTHCQLYPHHQLHTHSLTLNLTLTHSLSTLPSLSTPHSLAVKSTLNINSTLTHLLTHSPKLYSYCQLNTCLLTFNSHPLKHDTHPLTINSTQLCTHHQLYTWSHCYLCSKFELNARRL